MSLILGIDPGLASTGWGIIDVSSRRPQHRAHGVIRTQSKERTPKRLQIIYQGLKEVITQYKPFLVGVENLFFAKNVKSAMPVSEAKGVILLCTEDHGLSAVEYTPLQIKQALVGHGRADKNQVQEMVRLLLGLTELPKPDHAADALAAAICAFHSRGVIQGGLH